MPHATESRLGRAAEWAVGLLSLTIVLGCPFSGPDDEPPPSNNQVPYVIGQTQTTAQSAITVAGYTVGTVASIASTTIAAGTVISQDPVGTSPAAQGTAVSLVVSGGPPPASTLDKWNLWSSGTTKLRGANIYQRRVYPALDGPTFYGPGPMGPPFVQSDFTALAALGCNYVNISHPGLYSETPPFTLDTAVRQNLDRLIAMIGGADMFAVISFRTGPGRSEFTFHIGDDTTSSPSDGWFPASYYNDTVWLQQSAQDAWVTMWTYTAQRYAGNPVVVGYDLMVEPNSNETHNGLNIFDPEDFYDSYPNTLYDWNQFHPDIAAGIRTVDTTTPIIVGSMSYSAVDWLPYLQTNGDSKTVYAVHQYAPIVYTHQDVGDNVTYPGTFDADWDGSSDSVNSTWLNNLLGTVDAYAATHSVPVCSNEFGLVRWAPGAGTFMDDLMTRFEQRGMNYALWDWSPSWREVNEENDAFDMMHGSNPNNHADVASSPHITAVTKHWGYNTVRPSSVK